MGFMDKAKQLAEQAQQKLDEAQKNLNQSASPGSEGASPPSEGASPQSQPAEGGVRYDEHGRPIQEAPPAGAAPPPAVAERHPEGPEPTRQPDPGETLAGAANTSPDPFRPLE